MKATDDEKQEWHDWATHGGREVAPKTAEFILKLFRRIEAPNAHYQYLSRSVRRVPVVARQEWRKHRH